MQNIHIIQTDTCLEKKSRVLQIYNTSILLMINKTEESLEIAEDFRRQTHQLRPGFRGRFAGLKETHHPVPGRFDAPPRAEDIREGNGEKTER